MEPRWRLHPADPLLAQELARALGIHPLTAQLLLNRGVGTPEDAARFLQPTLERLGDPYQLFGMARGVARLRQAIARREPIFLFSDSDVDGLTAGVLLTEVLQELGATVRAQAANRITDGYGLPQALVRPIVRSKSRLVVLVDCGTNQPAAIRALAAHGIDTIIVDHHVPLQPAGAHALINPHAGSGPGRELCSAGLALKVAQALFGADAPQRLPPYLDLASLGTVADCSPLVGESRIIVAEGLPRLLQTARPGLRRLCEATGLSEASVDAVARKLAPRLNASGRLGDTSAVWKLLGRQGDAAAQACLASAHAAHQQTKEWHRRVLAQAQAQVSRLHFRDRYVLVVSGEGWPQGVMGPVASQLAERYGRPAVAIAVNERVGVGSARSVPSVDLLQALTTCQDMLVRFGGHAQACGLTIDVQHVEAFRALLNQRVQEAVGPQGLRRTLLLDLELALGAVAADWVEELQRLRPFGQGNPRPAVLMRRMRLEPKSPRVGWICEGARRVLARGSYAGLRGDSRYDVVVSPSLDGDGTLTLSLRSVKDSTAL